MAETKPQNLWYHIYVLFLLLIICIFNVATRNLPSYLITVQVPDCEGICKGVATHPLCSHSEFETFPISKSLTPYEACQLCRGRVLPTLANNLATNFHSVESDNALRPLDSASVTILTSVNGAADEFDLGFIDEEKEKLKYVNSTSYVPKRALPQSHRILSPEVGLLVPSAKTVLNLQAATNPTELFQPKVVRIDGEAMLNDFGTTRDTFLSAQNAGFFNLVDGACLHHWEYGILIGYGFAIVFAIGSVPAGYICDRKSRVGVVSAVLLMWSVATSLQAAGHDFWFLFGCRAVVGFSQAFFLPAAISLTADYFTDKQNIAVSVLSVGQYVGSGCASLSILFAGSVGWRWTALLTGMIGMIITPIFYHTVKEPERTEWSAPCAISVVTEEVFEKSRVARSLIVAGSFKMLGSCSLSAFLPIWYARRGMVGYSNTLYALTNALVILTGGLAACFIGSFIGHKWSQRDARAPCWIGLFGAIFTVPLICLVVLTPHFSVSMQCFFLLVIFSESWHGPTVTLLQTSVRKSVRGQAVSMFLVVSTLAGNLGPALVGFLDLGREHIGVHLIWICTFANVAAAVAFVWTAREINLDPVAAGLGTKQESIYNEYDIKRIGTAHWSVL